MMRRLAVALAILAVFGFAACASAVQVLVNGDFEGGSTGGVPNGWTKATSTIYSCNNYTADWRLFSSNATMNNYPPLDVYAGTYSLGAYRVDGPRCPPPGPGLSFFEYNVLYQTIPVNPNTTYYVRASGAAFVHHDRWGDLEDFWGAGAEFRICPGAGNYNTDERVWCHGFWNWEGESCWCYYPELKNQLSQGAANRFTTGPTQTSITFSVLWLTKWDVDMDLTAVDNIALDLSTTGPEPPGSESYVTKDPPTWTNPDPVWAPAERTMGWCRPGAVNGGDQFHQSAELTTGMYPRNSATGDFNADGLLDIAVASEWSHLVTVFLQKRDGTFTAGTHYGGAIVPVCVQAAQVIGSPALDLVVSSAGKHEVLVYPGNGDGTFGVPHATPINGQPTWVAVGDFNNDTKTDFATGILRAGSTGAVTVYLGNGLGSFFRHQTISDLSNVSYLIAADLGGSGWGTPPDGNLDLAALSWNGTAYTFGGDGSGSFEWLDTIESYGRWKSTAMTTANFDEDPDNLPDLCLTYMWEADYAQIASNEGGCWFIEQPQPSENWLRPTRLPSGVDWLDSNLDGHPDLAFSLLVSNDIELFENTGYDGTPPQGMYNFAKVGHYGVGNINTHLAARDMNSDGYTDMIVTGGGSQTVNVVYSGPGSTVYAPDTPHFSSPSAVAIANYVRLDPKLDIAIGETGTMRVYRNDGNLSFAETYSGTLNGACVALRSADLNSDGTADFVAISQPTTGMSSFTVAIGNGYGSFTPTSYAVATGIFSSAQDLAIGDVDNANGPDLVASEAYTNMEGIFCRTNGGGGVFTTASKKTALPAGSKPRDIVLADFNGDGKRDVVVALSAQNRIGLLTGKGDGYFNAPVYFNTGTEPTGVCSGDFTGDGKLDIAVTCKSANTVMVFVGNGAGSFTAGATVVVGTSPTHLESSDFNADGKADLVVCNSGDMTVSYLRGNGDGTFQPQQQYRTAGAPVRPAAADLRGIGLPDLFIAAGKWQILRNGLLSTGGITVTDDGATQPHTDHINGYWTATTAPGRWMFRYRWAVSTTPDTSGIIPGGEWLYTTEASGTRAISLSAGQTYYILAQGEDSARLWTSVGVSDGIVVQTPTNVDSAAEAKLLADGQSVSLSGVVVSRVWMFESPWTCYVQDQGRASGIRVRGLGAIPDSGRAVTVTGTMGSFGPEREIVGADMDYTGSPGEPGPLGLPGRSLGGSGFLFSVGPPVSGQAGVADGVGLNNVGLLVTIAGRVTRSDWMEDSFYVDDGSGLLSGGFAGVRCIAAEFMRPDAGSYVVVTGISGAIDSAGQTVRCVRVSRQEDIRTVP